MWLAWATARALDAPISAILQTKSKLHRTKGCFDTQPRAADAGYHHDHCNDCRHDGATDKEIEAIGDRRWRSDASEASWPGHGRIHGDQGSPQGDYGGDPSTNPPEMRCRRYPQDDEKNEDKLTTAPSSLSETLREGRRRGPADEAVSPGDLNKRQEGGPTHHRDRE